MSTALTRDTRTTKIEMDSQGFALLFHPGGWRAGSLDLNALMPEDLEYLARVMRWDNRFRKVAKDPRDPWDGVIRLPEGSVP